MGLTPNLKSLFNLTVEAKWYTLHLQQYIFDVIDTKLKISPKKIKAYKYNSKNATVHIWDLEKIIKLKETMGVKSF